MDDIVNAKILLNKSFVEVSLDETGKIVNAQWKGFLRLEQVKEGCDFITEYVKKNNITKHLSDHSLLKVLSKEVQAYLTQVWFKEVEQNGLRRIAVKLAEDVFAQVTVNNVNTKTVLGNLEIRNFNSYVECYRWLNE